jgi:hypothetical protein
MIYPVITCNLLHGQECAGINSNNLLDQFNVENSEI